MQQHVEPYLDRDSGNPVTCISGNLTILNLTNRAEAWALSEQNAPEVQKREM